MSLQLQSDTSELAGFQKWRFDESNSFKELFVMGSGPPVVVMHEVPGITPTVRQFGERVAAEGFTVYLPQMFGTPNRPPSPTYLVSSILSACIRREFAVLAANGHSPIIDDLRALCRAVHERHGGRGVGAVGMCLTGNFALSLMVEPCVRAPVLSQPSLPFTAGPVNGTGLHATPATVETVKRRLSEENLKLLGLRFSHDFMCPRQRFDELERRLGDGFEGITIDSSAGNTHGIRRMAHSVLTEDLVDEKGHPTRAALDRVLELFRDELTHRVDSAAPPTHDEA